MASALVSQSDVFKLPLPSDNEGEFVYYDQGRPRDRVTGLTLRVRAAGSRRWVFYYRFGGSQKRPNIHVEDIAELYIDLLTRPKGQISGKIYNAAYENHTVAELAEIVRRTVMREMPELGEIAKEVAPAPAEDEG